MKKKTLLTALIVVLSGGFANAKLSYEHPPYFSITSDDDIKSKWDAAVGTFQFEILNSYPVRNIQIRMEVIDQILENRHATEITYIEYEESIRIKILPESVIGTDFTPLELMLRVESFN